MDSFAELYEHYYPDVYRFALFLTGDRARAEDLASDTFVRAWMARDRIRHPTVRAYLLAIARNLHRDQRRLNRLPPLELNEGRPDDRPRVDVRVEHRSELRHVRARLKGVAPGDRRALLLYVVREMSYDQIATRLGISIGSVKSRIARARDALRMSASADRKRETPS
jgi:RNA polymerase sigma-70 factor (ECF subfamily)